MQVKSDIELDRPEMTLDLCWFMLYQFQNGSDSDDIGSRFSISILPFIINMGLAATIWPPSVTPHRAHAEC